MLVQPFISHIPRLLSKNLYGAKKALNAIDLHPISKTILQHLSSIFHSLCSIKTAFTNVASNP